MVPKAVFVTGGIWEILLQPLFITSRKYFLNSYCVFNCRPISRMNDWNWVITSDT